MTPDQKVVVDIYMLARFVMLAGFIVAVVAPLAGKKLYGSRGLVLSFIPPLVLFIATVQIAVYYKKCSNESDCLGVAILFSGLMYLGVLGMGIWLASAVLITAYSVVATKLRTLREPRISP